MFTEDDLLPISALQHLAFCERQWALIHLEGIWQENRLTAEGVLLHDHAHEAETEVRGTVRIARGLRLRSLRLGLIGKSDVVEFHKVKDHNKGVHLNGTTGYWEPLIVEYKRGSPKIGREDEVQVCAQAMCLEEMLGVTISTACIFYGRPRRRHELILDDSVRNETEKLITRLHDLTLMGITPLSEYQSKCKSCSLITACLPETMTGRVSVKNYMKKVIVDNEIIR